MHFARTADGIRVWWVVRQGSGALRTGIAASQALTAIEPGDSATSTPTVNESSQLPGTYYADIPSAFFSTNGTGHYSVVIQVTASPLEAEHELLFVSDELWSDLAQPGDAMDLVANAVDAAAIATDAIDADAIAADAIGASELATSAVNEIRDGILADSTPFNGADIAAILADTAAMQPLVDVAISTRAAPGDAMALTAAALVALADSVWDEDIVAAHGTADTAGLLLRALGAVLSQRSNNANLNDLLGVPDSAGVDLVDRIATFLETAGPNPHGTGAWDATASISQQDVRDAMKLAPTAGAPAAGSIDQELDGILADTAAMEPLVSANLDAQVSLVETDAAAAARAAATQALITALNDLSATDVENAVWDAAKSGHVVAGSFGEAVVAAAGHAGLHCVLDGGAGAANIPDDGDNNLVSARLRIFATKALADAAALGAVDGADGELLRLNIDLASYTAGNQTPNIQRLVSMRRTSA